MGYCWVLPQKRKKVQQELDKEAEGGSGSGSESESGSGSGGSDSDSGGEGKKVRGMGCCLQSWGWTVARGQAAGAAPLLRLVCRDSRCAT